MWVKRTTESVNTNNERVTCELAAGGVDLIALLNEQEGRLIYMHAVYKIYIVGRGDLGGAGDVD